MNSSALLAALPFEGSPIPVSWPDIIQRSSASPLGIIALASLIIGALAFAFFGAESAKLRLTAFVLVFLGLIGGVFAAISTAREQRPNLQSNTTRAPSQPPASKLDSASVMRQTGFPTSPVRQVSTEYCDVTFLVPSEFSTAQVRVDNKLALVTHRNGLFITVRAPRLAGMQLITLRTDTGTCETRLVIGCRDTVSICN